MAKFPVDKEGRRCEVVQQVRLATMLYEMRSRESNVAQRMTRLLEQPLLVAIVVLLGTDTLLQGLARCDGSSSQLQGTHKLDVWFGNGNGYKVQPFSPFWLSRLTARADCQGDLGFADGKIQVEGHQPTSIGGVLREPADWWLHTGKASSEAQFSLSFRSLQSREPDRRPGF